jgi:uncharacterized membrane protein YidH (DUF202 family)
MKRSMLIAGLLATVLVPELAHAAIISSSNPDTGPSALRDIVNVIVKVIEFGLAFAAAISVVSIVINAYGYITSGGNPERIEKAKSGLLWSILGFILIVSSFGIVQLLQQVLKSRQTVNSFRPPDASTSAQNTVSQVIEMLLIFAAAIAMIYLILGGYRYITAQGDRDTSEKAKKTVLYAVIGLVVTMGAVAIFSLANNSLNGSLSV